MNSKVFSGYRGGDTLSESTKAADSKYAGISGKSADPKLNEATDASTQGGADADGKVNSAPNEPQATPATPAGSQVTPPIATDGDATVKPADITPTVLSVSVESRLGNVAQRVIEKIKKEGLEDQRGDSEEGGNPDTSVTNNTGPDTKPDSDTTVATDVPADRRPTNDADTAVDGAKDGKVGPADIGTTESYLKSLLKTEQGMKRCMTPRGRGRIVQEGNGKTTVELEGGSTEVFNTSECTPE